MVRFVADFAFQMARRMFKRGFAMFVGHLSRDGETSKILRCKNMSYEAKHWQRTSKFVVSKHICPVGTNVSRV